MSGDQLSAVFGALADPTRRAILARLATGDATVAELAEPFPVSQPPLPLAAPTLAVSGARPDLTLSWTWPAADDASEVIVERSTDGTSFERVSPRLPASATTTGYRAPAGPAFLRLRARRLDGRTAVSNAVGI